MTLFDPRIAEEFPDTAPDTLAADQLAFEQTVIYHQRRTTGDDGCTKCGPLAVGSSFAEHLWESYRAALAAASPVAAEGTQP